MIIDARGMVCPQPIIETKKAINSLTEKTHIEVLIEDEIAVCNVSQYLTELGIAYTKSDGKIEFNAEPNHKNEKEAVCTVGAKSADASYAVVINSLSMGHGDDALGKILLKAFISTVEQSCNLPSHIIFYNSGVHCCTPEAGVIETIQKLEDKGVTVIVCGTCVDYFGIKDKLEVGVVSNMYKIVEILQSVSKVVYP